MKASPSSALAGLCLRTVGGASNAGLAFDAPTRLAAGFGLKAALRASPVSTEGERRAIHPLPVWYGRWFPRSATADSAYLQANRNRPATSAERL
jgi:hypothetical protein